MNLKVAITVLILFSLISLRSLAQENTATHKLNVEVPELALLGLVTEGDGTVGFRSGSTDQAGDELDLSNTNSNRIWINYSSIVSQTTPNRKVIASIQGEIPKGLTLKVKASEVSGSGKGSLGQSAGEVTLTNEPTDVIVGIGSCYTGNGVNNGHYITYKLENDPASDEYAMAAQQHTSLNVIYTLTDYN